MTKKHFAVHPHTKRCCGVGVHSFTLIELLIVIGILAILTAAVVIVLNPAELLRQGRDSTRMTDVASVADAMKMLQTQSETVFTNSTASTVYISIPDPSSATCASLGLPTLPSGYTYHCVPSASSTAVDGTGWIPINFIASTVQSLSKLPLDPTNSSSSNLYYAYVAQPTTQTYTVYATTLESAKYQNTPSIDGGISTIAFERGSNPGLMPPQFPYGSWVKVPGNSTFGTSDFYVMKYNAKCFSTSTNLPYNTPSAAYDTGYRTYADSSYPCTNANGKYMTSAPSGFPIANISHTTALTYCASIGAHLLTNDEYMTIATNAAAQGNNWQGGVVGTNYLYSGHNDNAPAYALEAGSDDSNGYFGETNIGGNQRRTFLLSNNQVIWDMAGNVWQHVQRSTNNVGDATNAMSLPACSSGTAAWGWCQYGNSATPYLSSWTSDVAQNKVGPPTTSWNSSQGMGQVYTYQNGISQGTTVFLRGATWFYGSNAGAFALLLSWGAGGTNGYVGLRCAR